MAAGAEEAKGGLSLEKLLEVVKLCQTTYEKELKEWKTIDHNEKNLRAIVGVKDKILRICVRGVDWRDFDKGLKEIIRAAKVEKQESAAEEKKQGGALKEGTFGKIDGGSSIINLDFWFKMKPKRVHKDKEGKAHEVRDHIPSVRDGMFPRLVWGWPLMGIRLTHLI